MISIFIVNQNRNKCERLEKVTYDLNYDDKTLDALEEIYNRIYPKRYNWGSTENCLRGIKKEQDRYLTYNKCKKIFRIYVNGNLFAVYNDVIKGSKVFDEILEEIKANSNIFDLSEKKYEEGETSKN